MSLTGCHCRLGAGASSVSSSGGGGETEKKRASLDSKPDYLHVDIIDGHFFSAVTPGSEMVKSLRERLPDTFLDVHLMVEDPEKWIEEVASAGANRFTFHLEATSNPSRLISCVRDKNMKVGIALKPVTPVEGVLPYLTDVDTVLVMSVEPGQDRHHSTNNNTSLKVESLRQKCPHLKVLTDGWDELPEKQVKTTSRKTSAVTALKQLSTMATTSDPMTSDPTTSLLSSSSHCTSPTSRSYGSVGNISSNRGFPYDASETTRFLINDKTCSQEKSSSVQCDCHVKVEDNTARNAKIKLVIASVIALLFMIGEVLGGYFANSLAIMTDAAHMLSDFAGFLISLFAIWLASRPSSSRMSFGWHRAEVVGAVVSVLIIWVITGVLFYEAILRVLHPERFDINADIMLITACIGVFVNVLMCTVLHTHSHSHSHGHSKKQTYSESVLQDNKGAMDLKDMNSGAHKKRRFWQRRKKHKHGSQENINVRAAFIHVIGDLIQSVGVVIAGYIIKFKPEWKLADPICTFIFCILVLISTLNVLKDALRVLMEGTPKHINYAEVKRDLVAVPGVRNAHSLHIWSLTLNKTALAAHLVLDSKADHQSVLNNASKMLRSDHNITSTTLQVEDHHESMEDCDACKETTKRSLCWPL